MLSLVSLPRPWAGSGKRAARTSESFPGNPLSVNPLGFLFQGSYALAHRTLTRPELCTALLELVYALL